MRFVVFYFEWTFSENMVLHHFDKVPSLGGDSKRATNDLWLFVFLVKDIRIKRDSQYIQSNWKIGSGDSSIRLL